ncbi:DUF2911 domain-containing protein [Mucilaginibacter sp. BJC16-A38]|uniref:DUF2911 domain-containing protein n=1 Tax=Mucilaginibacter phenanthrenivorans TaxID=1234842 RepID=UPI0021575331|nr:DUF2911 domain-containing protein [Mucilaginibacter phenanthrenivorans]MCR8558047.1 DUF2911 domain-containing protein [Mucilaginibacter phenanthrenivorans]
MNPSRLLTIAIVFFTVSSYAQITPQPSTTQTITQDFGLGKINLTYSRPNTKGRKIFGVTEPYDKVWRTGANSATVLKFSDDVSLEGHKVPAGEYGLFSIPGEKQWTIILSKNAKQWGAYSYKESEDFLRFTVTPEKTAKPVETFTIQFANIYPTSGEMQLMWQNTAVTIHLTCDIDSKIMANIDSAMKTDKKPYYDAVIYYWNNNKDMAKALAWANEMGKIPGMPPYVAKLWVARVQLKKGDKVAAAATAKEGVKLAGDGKNEEYVRLNSDVLAAATK